MAEAGDRIGAYRLVRRLGVGEQGQVFHAHDERHDRPVALKLVRLAAADGSLSAGLRARFHAEARSAHKLHHPNIAGVLAAGEAPGLVWLAMELAPGVGLDRYTRSPRLLPEALVLQAGAGVARALAHAHAAGVVHRDVKPSNIVVHWPSGSVKLSDFGMAWSADAESTRTGIVLGSPAFLAPEQLAGALPEPRTDLYALGATLFQLFCGRVPFEAPSMGELLRKVAQSPAPDLRIEAPAVSTAAAKLIGRLLAKRAAERPAAATEVAEELEREAQAAAPAVPSSRG